MGEQTGGLVITQFEEGRVVGGCEILSTAGSGGMGVVYKARQRSLDRIVALKLIREDIARVPEYRERFLREARLAASVNHPNVVSVYDVGDEGDQLFLVMQWIEGKDLKHMLAQIGRLAPDRAVAIAVQLAGALDAVHGVFGLIHRDVKPANVLMRQIGGDHAYLTDFGVARPSETAERLTQTGWVVGTVGYLSPEQIRGEEPGPRSDLYALGCLFFEALTGQPPFTGENEMALRWAHANDPRPTASAAAPVLGDRYDRFFSVAMAIGPAVRFGSGREFAEALKAAHGAETASTYVEPLVPPHAPTAVGPPTPTPPPANTPLPPPGAYPGYGYGTPSPPYPQQRRSGNPLALVLLAIVAVAGIAVGALAATGVFTRASPVTKTIVSSTASGAIPKHKTSVGGPSLHAPSKPHPNPASDSGVASVLRQYWTDVNGGDYHGAYSLSTGRVASSSTPSVFQSEQPAINVMSLGQPVSTGSGSAQLPIDFYAEDTTGSDAGTCREFTGDATMELVGRSWLYADNNYAGSVANGNPNCPGGAPSKPPPSAASDTGAASTLSQYWADVNSGDYTGAYSLSTGPVASTSPPSKFQSEQPAINVMSVGQPVSTGSGSAQVSIDFYAEDTTGSDAGTCREFTGDATMELVGGSWLYAENNYTGSVVSGNPNCPGG